MMCYDGVRKPQAEIDRIAVEAYREIVGRLWDAKRLLQERLFDPEACFPRRIPEQQIASALSLVSRSISEIDGDVQVDGRLWCDANPSSELINGVRSTAATGSR